MITDFSGYFISAVPFQIFVLCNISVGIVVLKVSVSKNSLPPSYIFLIGMYQSYKMRLASQSKPKSLSETLVCVLTSTKLYSFSDSWRILFFVQSITAFQQIFFKKILIENSWTVVAQYYQRRQFVVESLSQNRTRVRDDHNKPFHIWFSNRMINSVSNMIIYIYGLQHPSRRWIFITRFVNS
jgi:hypothetical protein